MKTRFIVVVLIGVAMGLFSSSFMRSSAQDQVKQDKQEWEFTVETFRVGEGMESTHSRIINGLAAEGWQYVGLVGTGQVQNHSYAVGNVLFKRVKK